MGSTKRPADAPLEDMGSVPTTLSRAISPPRKRQRKGKVVPSPWQLTWIRDLPESENRDAVTLRDLLGDPLIYECWEFNYLHDVNFLMNAFDADTRHLVNVHVVHGFWKREDGNRLMLVDQAKAFPNVQLHTAPMPEIFGTHHTKMMILLRHDETAQIIIHTANMIAKDWTNMTNAVWESPPLPRLPVSTSTGFEPRPPPLGSGWRFKHDLLSYLKAYDSRQPVCKPLVDSLSDFDFSSIKASFIASVPGRHSSQGLSRTAWGWPALKKHLATIPTSPGDAQIAIQISSIATLGGKDEWLQKAIFNTVSETCSAQAPLARPTFRIVFPTSDEIRRSLDGYESGGSIHTKIQSAQQAKQLQYLRPMLHHWANDSAEGASLPSNAIMCDGGHQRAAPHIKTYIRHNDGLIDWALLTSANLSKQAWGDAAQASGEVRIASWEAGVLVWPQLFGPDAMMVPAFGSDTPEPKEGDEGTRVGIRVPYNMPLQRYGSHEIPWVATMDYTEPDCKGRSWTTWSSG